MEHQIMELWNFGKKGERFIQEGLGNTEKAEVEVSLKDWAKDLRQYRDPGHVVEDGCIQIEGKPGAEKGEQKGQTEVDIFSPESSP